MTKKDCWCDMFDVTDLPTGWALTREFVTDETRPVFRLSDETGRERGAITRDGAFNWRLRAPGGIQEPCAGEAFTTFQEALVTLRARATLRVDDSGITRPIEAAETIEKDLDETEILVQVEAVLDTLRRWAIARKKREASRH